MSANRMISLHERDVTLAEAYSRVAQAFTSHNPAERLKLTSVLAGVATRLNSLIVATGKTDQHRRRSDRGH